MTTRHHARRLRGGRLLLRARGRFNALVILTDGVNEDPGGSSRSTLVSELQEATDPDRPVPLIAIAVGPETDRNDLELISNAANGSAYEVSNPSQIQSVILKAIVQAGSRLQ